MQTQINFSGYVPGAVNVRCPYRKLNEAEQTKYSKYLCAIENKVHVECIPWDELPFLEKEMFERNIEHYTTIDLDNLIIRYERWGCTCDCIKFGCKQKEKLCPIAKHLEKQ